MSARVRGAVAAVLGLVAGAAPGAESVARPTIVGIEIEAPDAEARRLARYVSIVPGSTLEPEAIRRLVELVFATGQYEDVVVDAEPAQGGVRVIVRPRPAPLLTAIRVEGKSVLKTDEVRRLGGLREREALFPADLEQAARRLEEALRSSGYPNPRVSAVTRRVPSGAEAVFSVDAGERLVVGEVRIEGAGPLESLARQRLAPRPGERVDMEKARRSAERAGQALAEAGYWRATVTPPSSVSEEGSGATLVFKADVGPHMVVAYEGNVPRGKVRKAVEKIVREGKAREDALDQASERLEAEERRRGARGGGISRRIEPRGNSTAVVFTVAPSVIATVGAVSIDGWSRVPTLKTRVGAPLDETTLEADAATIKRLVLAEGYPRAEVTADARAGGGSVPVVFHVRTGPKTVVGVFTIDAPAEIRPLIEEHAAHMRSGDPYRVDAVAAERDEVVAALHNAGFAQAEVAPQIALSEEGDRADVVLTARPGRRDIVDRIVIAGLEKTREEVVRREIVLTEGKPLGLQGLLESQRRLSALGLFRAIQIDETEADAEGRRNVVVRVREASATSVAYGAGYGERDKLRFSAEVTRRNLAGMNRTLSTFVRWSFLTNRFLASYREPYLRGKQQDLFLSVYREEEERESFSFRRYGANSQTAFALSKQWSAILRYSFERTDAFRIQVPIDEVDRRFQSSTFSGPAISFVKDSRDDALDPSSGHFIGMDNQLSLEALGGDSFVKTFLQAAAYHRLGHRTVLATAGRLGLGRAFGVSGLSLPLPDRFFAGGDYSLRGYRLDTAGPVVLSTDGQRYLPTGGNALLLGSVELRFDAARHFSFAVFTDAGNVYPFVDQIDLGDVLYSAGAGIRYKSAIGPLRIDWGYKLNRRPQEKPYAFHVTVGHAF